MGVKPGKDIPVREDLYQYIEKLPFSGVFILSAVMVFMILKEEFEKYLLLNYSVKIQICAGSVFSAIPMTGDASFSS